MLNGAEFLDQSLNILIPTGIYSPKSTAKILEKNVKDFQSKTWRQLNGASEFALVSLFLSLNIFQSLFFYL